MWLSDTSVRRPVLALVMNLILIAFGIVAYTRLPVREYPDIEPPIVTVETYYRGASPPAWSSGASRSGWRIASRRWSPLKTFPPISTDGKIGDHRRVHART
jgi:hypothetical protein